MTGEATQLLKRWSSGDQAAGKALWPIIYEDLRRIAHRHLSGNGGPLTLDPTALVHEAWFELRPEHAGNAANRRQYMSFASRVMRTLLVDHMRRRYAEKRGGRCVRVTLAGVASNSSSEFDVLAVHDLVNELAATDAELGRIAELRIFGGLTQEEIAESLGMSKRTLERRWRVAAAWLQRELA